MKKGSIYALRSVVLGLGVASLLIVGGALRADTPIAADDYATTPQNTPVLLSVLTNDTTGPGDQLGILRVTPPAHGKVSINSVSVPENPKLMHGRAGPPQRTGRRATALVRPRRRLSPSQRAAAT